VRWEHVPADKKTALARKRAIEDELYRNPPGNRPSRRRSANTDRWLEEYARQNVKPRVFTNYESNVRLHIKPALGTLNLTALRARHVKTLVAKLRSAGKSDATVRNVLVPLREMLSHAVVDELIAANPIAGLKLLGNGGQGNDTREIAPPTRDQIARLMEHIRAEALDALIVATVTGLRRSELFALRWRDIDWTAGIIRVRATNYAAKITETTKTRAGKRDVPLFGSARDVLTARKVEATYDRPDDLIFGTSVGTPTDPNNWVRREFKKAQQDAGLGEWVESDGEKRRWVSAFRFHDLRHYAVSELIKQKADILLLARIAGHEDPSITLRVYAHLLNDDVSEAAKLSDPLRRVEVDER
jgi:integrase